jgi:hypothetical protein
VPALAWVAGGVGLAAGGAAAFFGLRAARTERELKGGYDPNTNQYQGTRAQALSAKQDALLANIGFGIAGAGLLTSVLLTVFSGDDAKAPAAATTEVLPAAGPGSAGLIVRGRF